MGYKTKVIHLTPKRSTITSNEEKEMIKSTEIRNSNNTCSSRLNFFIFLQKIMFLGENTFFTFSESKIRKKKFKIFLSVRK